MPFGMIEKLKNKCLQNMQRQSKLFVQILQNKYLWSDFVEKSQFIFKDGISWVIAAFDHIWQEIPE